LSGIATLGNFAMSEIDKEKIEKLCELYEDNKSELINAIERDFPDFCGVIHFKDGSSVGWK